MTPEEFLEIAKSGNNYMKSMYDHALLEVLIEIKNELKKLNESRGI